MSATSGGKHDISVPSKGTIEYSITQKMSDAKASYITLLEACNFAGTAVTTPAGVSYEMKTSATDTLSIEWIDPRTTIQGRGGKGAFSLKAQINQPVEITFDYKFVYEGEVQLAAVDPDNTVPTAAVPGFLYVLEDCASYTINGASGHFESFEINWGASVVSPDTTCPAPNYVQEYAPTLTIVQSLTEDNEASFEELKTQSSKNIIIGLFDSTATKRGEIRIPNAVPNDLDKGGEEGRLKATKSFACLPTSGDDNIQIVIFD
ncbi:hypothetical protein PGH07_07795 [Sulfurovum sp. zt1-1]|uniref:Uncharacterized protein n=1 Tax=Sulfurovum zhangzhouensis TaxID=3019067 RepID=A0ABT7QZX1_9BACT|nr:hypothetical protein [Sulfurovum zhangzhouensis]MDM5272079.1 hypothetical protein [Sulfurovum zhangzhouensis]